MAGESESGPSKCSKETDSFLKIVREMNMDQIAGVSPEDARAKWLVMSRQLCGRADFSGQTKEYLVPTPHVATGIPVTAYKPEQLKPYRPTILVYFHGGGWCLGSRECVQVTCQMIARKAECIVVNVDFRLAPEHKFPAAYDDAKCVIRWVMMNKSLLGGINESIVGVAGDSSGGNIATSVCHEVHGVGYQILIYPILDLRLESKSYEEFADDPVLNKDRINWYLEHFLRDESDKTNPRGNPLLHKNLNKLPPTFLVITDTDMTRDDSYQYAKLLRAAGVKTKIVFIKGGCHAFFTLPGIFKDLADHAYDRVVDFIKSSAKNI